MSRSNYYIPVFDSLPGHRKERALRKAMGWNGFESVGFLVWFWLQVAADFPGGELPGLAELEATLRRVWEAALIKPQRKTIRKVMDVLRDETIAWVDVEVIENVEVVMVHDWEDGAGMFAVKRSKEAEKKRLQRNAAKKRVDSVPGTPESCPQNVPGEKEKEKEITIPPTPPQAGGGFEDFQKLVFRLWEEECGRVPVAVVRDNPTTAGAANFAKRLMDETITEHTVRMAMRGFLAMKYGTDAQMARKTANWNLNTVSKAPSSFLQKEDAAASPEAEAEAVEETREPMACWIMRCDTCGGTFAFDSPEADGVPGDAPCFRGLGKSRCKGVMRAVEKGNGRGGDDPEQQRFHWQPATHVRCHVGGIGTTARRRHGRDVAEKHEYRADAGNPPRLPLQRHACERPRFWRTL